LSGLLPLRFPELRPTLGTVGVAECLQHYDVLQRLGLDAAPLACEGIGRLSAEPIESFRASHLVEGAGATSC